MTRDEAVALWARVLDDYATLCLSLRLRNNVDIGVLYSGWDDRYSVHVWHSEEYEGDVATWADWEHRKQALRELDEDLRAEEAV